MERAFSFEYTITWKGVLFLIIDNRNRKQRMQTGNREE